jgi:hypothetical protein
VALVDPSHEFRRASLNHLPRFCLCKTTVYGLSEGSQVPLPNLVVTRSDGILGWFDGR